MLMRLSGGVRGPCVTDAMKVAAAEQVGVVEQKMRVIKQRMQRVAREGGRPVPAPKVEQRRLTLSNLC
jgi:hypothetical protein